MGVYLHFFFSTFIMESYNKLEEDFQSEPDPLRAYNDYLEDVENISMFNIIISVLFSCHKLHV